MPRPPRIEFPNALYHVTSRGNRQAPIFHDTRDRHSLLDILSDVLPRFDAAMLAYCLMGNHYHFVLQTRRANLSQLMREINGPYTQAFNARHGCVGHVFQGRYKAIVVDTDAYLADVCRYVELNPVRAGLASNAAEWPWSSYLAHVGRRAAPAWLATAILHGHLLRRVPVSIEDRREAAFLYERHVQEGMGVDLWRDGLRDDLFLGDETFAYQALAQAGLGTERAARDNGPARARQRLEDYLSPLHTRGESMRRAHVDGGLTMTEIARQAGVSVSVVSRLIGRAKAVRQGES